MASGGGGNMLGGRRKGDREQVFQGGLFKRGVRPDEGGYDGRRGGKCAMLLPPNPSVCGVNFFCFFCFPAPQPQNKAGAHRVESSLTGGWWRSSWCRGDSGSTEGREVGGG